MNQLFEDEATKAYTEQGILIKTKRSYYRVWRFLDVLLKIITFGKMNRFLTHYTTTIGRTIYFPIHWQRSNASKRNYVTLRHERKHVWRARKLGFGNTTLGTIIFGFLYFLIFFPVGLAWFRYTFEREAYLESYKACKEVGIKPNVAFYIDVLTGPDYVWTWPFRKSVRRWFYKNCT